MTGLVRVAPGHDGVCGNKRADQHAKGAADSMGAQWASAGALCHGASSPPGLNKGMLAPALG